MQERDFQSKLIKRIHTLFPESIVMKLDAGYLPGIPDLLILNGEKWASLECKKDAFAHKQPNQEYYVDKMNRMSYSAFIYPENEEEILNEIQQAFGTGRKARRTKR